MKLHRLWFIAVGGSFALCMSAEAGELDAAEVQKLLIHKFWRVESGASSNFLLWHPDGTLCVKVHAADADGCDDTGIWTQDGDKLCYELEWWGKAYNVHQGCMRIRGSESGGYEMIDANGFVALRFAVPGQS